MTTTKFDDSHPNPLTAGEPLTIVYKNPALANTTVVVTASDGSGDDHEVSIVLDENGRGEKEFTVPSSSWLAVVLTGPSTGQKTIPIN